MFHSVGRIMGWAKNYRKRMILGFVCSFFATWCTAGPVMLAAWALGRMIGNAWGENELSGSLPWLCLSGIVVLILLRFFFTYWKNRLQESIGTERAAEQRMELGDVLKRVSLGYFAKNNLGDILAALTTELSTLELQSMKMVDAVVNGYIQVAVILLCVAIFCPPAALVALIGVLVSAGQQTDKDDETLYNYFCAALDRALTDTAQAIDDNAQRGDLPRMALDLALRSYAAQLACARILDILQPEQEEPGHKSKK